MPAPIISVAQLRQWEAATWAAGRTESEVISRVGHILTIKVRQMTRPGDLVLVLAGKGHNGDDARHISQNLNDRDIYLLDVLDPAAALPEFLSQLSQQPSLIVDGLFGIGLNRPLNEDWIKLIDAINSARVPILAVDLPSGINADTGLPMGTAIRAAVTLTLAAPKWGLVASTAWPYVGRLEVAPDIGLVPFRPPTEWHWTLREDFAGYPPPRPVDGHKGTFGHVAVIAGSLGYHGAAVLAARGAQRAQPGLVTAIVQPDIYGPVAGQLQAAMVRPWKAPMNLPDTCTAVVMGPGLAAPDIPASFRDQIANLWKEFPGPVVADAGALEWLPTGAVKTGALRVVTPHPGEAGRLLGTNAAAVQKDRPQAVRELSARHGDAWVVLKGHQTLIGRRSGDLFLNSSGNPHLAQGGSGDVLAGYIGGLLAARSLQQDAVTTLRYAVWQHGAAADHLHSKCRNWVVEDLIVALGNIGN